jgi:putative endonuclease
MHKKVLGKIGEDEACQFLKDKGYAIIQRNFNSKFGEIDIIAKDKDCLCFIEVKTRSNLDLGSPLEAITLNKRRHLIRSAQHFMSLTKEDFKSARFDVAIVLEDDKIDVIKNAFFVE